MFLSVSVFLSLIVVVVAFYYTQTNSAMPSLAAIRASNAAFFRSKPAPSSAVAANVPTAVFVGGTSGIGEGMALTYAEHTEGKSNIIIVGRNAAAAERIFASMPRLLLISNPNSQGTILSRYAKINYLVMSPGYSTLAERGEAAVVSVMAAGYGGKIDLNDLGLKKGYSPTYNDLMMESFAEQAPNITYIHAAPGFVRTSLGSSSPSPTLRVVSALLVSLARPLSVSQTECGEYMWNAVASTATKPGAWRIGSKGEDLGMKRYFGGEEQRRRVWEHTVEVMRTALATSGPETPKAEVQK
ncbi:hypothetical protein CPB84DRAFT_1787979 [Gymnopilus junonius]|uniref:NAD(P)-binding protein n=1 Tax=Gymnopilus junonius TaxID=109634 RepID=A0A9P5NIR6_GYMJU|nr:hypothetical protein CPB84DRAFT_1787979 [Gymnopilus junonius]